jgi:hypothetical protein
MESLESGSAAGSASQHDDALGSNAAGQGNSDCAGVEVSKKRQLATAAEHDRRVREIERQLAASWSELAEIAIAVRDGQEWRILGFSSFNAWLADAAPRSRAMIYSAIGLLEELTDVPIQELRQIGIGNAHILKKLPRASRTSRGVLEAAKALPPRQMLATVIQSHPDHHLEDIATQKFKFTASQWIAIEEAIEECMSQYDGEITTREEALEAICAEWMESQ